MTNLNLSARSAVIIRTANKNQNIPVVALEVNLTKSVYVCDEGTIKIMTNKADIAYELFTKEEAFDVIIETNNSHSLNFPRFIKLLDVRIQTIRVIDSSSNLAEIGAICYKWTYVFNYKPKEKVKVMLI